MKSSQKISTIFVTIPSSGLAKTYPSITLPNSSTKPKSYETFSNKDFVSSITHELKNPLSAILGLVDLLKEDISNPQLLEECLGYVADIKQTALEMNELVHDLLDVNSGASGNFSVDLSKEIVAADVVERSVKLNRDYSHRRKVSLKVEIAEDVKVIRLDAKRMKQVLTNLISNAVKYSPRGSEVKIVAKNLNERNQKFLEITVTDQGFGMTPEQVQTAFQKYQTIPNPNSGIVDSFGLGLPITKQLVELQNGTIEVKSELNQGTEIRLRFPYSGANNSNSM